MTHDDIQFLKAVGINHCSLGDLLTGPLTPAPVTEAPILKLTGEDARWLQTLRVAWEHEVEPEFVPPTTLREYLVRFSDGVRQAVGEVAREMGLAMLDGGLDELALEVTQMFTGFVEADLEDVVALHGFHRSLHPEGLSFHDYMKFRVRACVPVVLQNRMSDTDNPGDSR